MADFGTILDPNNTTLNLYCNSITQSNPIVESLPLFSGFRPEYSQSGNSFIFATSTTYQQNGITNNNGIFTNMKPGLYVLNTNLYVRTPNDNNNLTNLILSYNDNPNPLSPQFTYTGLLEDWVAMAGQFLFRIEAPTDNVYLLINFQGGLMRISGSVNILYISH